MSTLVDSNVILDLLGPDPEWENWSVRQLSAITSAGEAIINPVVYAEVSIRYVDEREFDQDILGRRFIREPLPWSAAFRAGKAHLDYRRRGGPQHRTLPDFLIGAHAEVRGLRLLTRDPRRYRTYFPDVDVIAPDTHP